MNNEIMEILNKCTPFLFGDEVDKLLDYITNLQNENENNKKLKERYQLQKENYKSRCKKASEYMQNYIEVEELNEPVKIEFKEVINILDGGDKE